MTDLHHTMHVETPTKPAEWSERVGRDLVTIQRQLLEAGTIPDADERVARMRYLIGVQRELMGGIEAKFALFGKRVTDNYNETVDQAEKSEPLTGLTAVGSRLQDLGSLHHVFETYRLEGEL